MISLDNKSKIITAWKKAYVETVIKALKPKGDVLQLGYGLNDAATLIQLYKPKSHTIIEPNSDIVKEAKLWAQLYPQVKIIQEPWEKALPRLGQFDTIFFNDVMENELDIVKQLTPSQAQEFSDKAKEYLNMLEKEISQIEVKFTDQDIEDFYQQDGQYRLKELPGFFKSLKTRGFITDKQYVNAMKKYAIKEEGKKESKKDPLLQFLEECFKTHMHKGSRFSALLSDLNSKFEDPLFFDKIITNPDVDYKEEMTPLNVPDFQFNDVPVMVVEKLK